LSRYTIRGAVVLVTVVTAVVVAGVARMGALASGPNVVFLLLDTVRADAVGPYGARLSSTPKIDALAQRGVRFTRAVSNAPWTVPSVTSILKSRYPSEHGEGAQLLVDGAETIALPQLLREAGYKTAAFTEIAWPDLKNSFEYFENTMGTEAAALRLRSPDRVGAAVTYDHARRWIATHTSEPFFVFVHSYEAHDYYAAKNYQRDAALAKQPAYAGPMRNWSIQHEAEDAGKEITKAIRGGGPEDLAFLRNRYLAGVAALDIEIGRTLDSLAALGIADRTIVVVMADHGEGFEPELNRVHHAGRLHHDLLHIPLIIAWPGRLTPGIVEEPVEAIDVAPTVLQMVMGRSDRRFRGRILAKMESAWRTLFSAPRFSVKAQPEFVCFAEESALKVLPDGSRQQTTDRQFTVYEKGMKLIRGVAGEELYDLDRDPGEIRNLVTARPQVAAALRQRLGRTVAAMGSSGARPEDAKRISDVLRAIGYIR
jgi:arylsulfatase A-like enzyme